jgi:membrane protein implicated in regulation of membrane protease activity
MNKQHQLQIVRCLYLYDTALMMVGVFLVWWAIICFMGGVDAKPPTIESTIAGLVFLGLGLVVIRCAYGLTKSTRNRTKEIKEEQKKETANQAL